MNDAASLETLLRLSARNAPNRFVLWEKIINVLQPETMLELGVWRGEFAAHILAHCPSIKRYYFLDPWRPLPAWNKPLNIAAEALEEGFAAAMKATDFARHKVKVLRGTTNEVADQIDDESLDIAYVDGDHTLRGITIDLANMLPKVRPHGFLAGDDFCPTIWQHSAEYEPTLVFPYAVYFAEAHRLPIYGLPFSQYVMHKDAAGYGFVDLAGAYATQDLLPQLSGKPARPRPQEIRFTISENV